MSFKIEENNIVSLKKDCKKCEHIDVCKFHSNMKELCNSNQFYGMTKYLEWNNSLGAFEKHASCQFYKLNYDIPDDGSLHLGIDIDIIKEIIRLEKPDNLHSHSYDIDHDEASYYIKDSETVVLKITDLLAKYSFVPKEK